MNISLIEPVGGHGGMNYYDMSLARALAGLGVRIFWYTCDETLETAEPGVEVKKTFKGIYGKANKFLRLYRFLIGLIWSLALTRFNGAKIVHYHFFGMGPLEASMCLCAKMFGCRIVATVHDVESFSHSDASSWCRLVLSTVSRLVVHNMSSMKALLEVAPKRFDAEAVSVIHHGNYRDYVVRYPSKSSRKALGLSETGSVVLLFGQIKKVKGLDVLLKAIPGVLSKMNGVTFLIAGKVWKDDFSDYQLLIDELGLKNSVKAHIRYIPDDEVDLYYSSSDVVVLPYRKIYQSGVLLMAMSYGLPAIASNLPGMAEVIAHGENGLLFENGNSDDLAKKIVEALSDEKRRLAMGASALSLMQREYSWNSIAEETKAIYEGLV